MMTNVSRQLPRTRRPAFTLVELVLAVCVSSVLLLGLTSAMMIAGSASRAVTRQQTGDVRALLEQLREDAAAATAVGQLTGTSMTLTVPDRTGDGQVEQVVYDWSTAAASGTITRSLNGAARIVAIGATSFSVTPTTTQLTTDATSTSPEVLLYRRTPLLTLGAYAIKNSQSCGQLFSVSLPTAAVTWNVTRVRLPLRSKGPTGGITRVQVRAVATALPSLVLDETALYETSLGTSFGTREFSFNATATTQAAANASACVVLQWDKDADAAEAQYESLLSALGSGSWVASTDGAVTWTANTLRCMPIEVYGTYKLQAGTVVRRLTALSIQFTPREPALQSPIKTTVRFPNAPEVTG